MKLQVTEEEEGELRESKDSYSLDRQIEETLEEGEEQRAEASIREKEKRCQTLKATLKKEQSKAEEWKKQRIKQMQARFKKLQKTEEALSKSLTSSRGSSRTSTPLSSPRSKLRRTPEYNKSKIVKKSTKNGSRCRTSSAASRGGVERQETEGNSEYNQIVSSLFDLKNGKVNKFSKLLSKTMEANSNLREGFGSGVQSLRKQSVNSSDNTIEQVWSIGTQLGQKQLLALLNELKVVKADNRSKVGVNKKTIREEKGDMEGDPEGDNLDKKGKKLVGGKCTRLDESDIKVVVKYAHEKLDVKHAQERVFDRLPFNLLVVGELEIALLQEEPKKSARIQMAKTVCYHHQYLRDEDLRNGYDSVLKRVEQGTMTWEDQLGEELHSYIIIAQTFF